MLMPFSIEGGRPETAPKSLERANDLRLVDVSVVDVPFAA